MTVIAMTSVPPCHPHHQRRVRRRQLTCPSLPNTGASVPNATALFTLHNILLHAAAAATVFLRFVVQLLLAHAPSSQWPKTCLLSCLPASSSELTA